MNCETSLFSEEEEREGVIEDGDVPELSQTCYLHTTQLRQPVEI